MIELHFWQCETWQHSTRSRKLDMRVCHKGVFIAKFAHFSNDISAETHHITFTGGTASLRQLGNKIKSHLNMYTQIKEKI